MCVLVDSSGRLVSKLVRFNNSIMPLENLTVHAVFLKCSNASKL